MHFLFCWYVHLNIDEEMLGASNGPTWHIRTATSKNA
uniref:Uncharacterized protein n=1 Tax=Rhizophora mucronata TaxID=61149 RepID=A0A2P2NS45_RHIMU